MSGLRVCMISEHASPLAAPGGADSGGQNVYVAQLATNLARMGMQVDVFTRRDAAGLSDVVEFETGARVVHVPAGPAEFLAKENMWGHMHEFGDWLLRQFSAEDYDLIHGNFWMSADVARRVSAAWNVPFVVTFHALGLVRLQHQAAADGFPAERADIERAAIRAAECVIAECPQDKEDLVTLYGADPAKVHVVPCGIEPTELFPQPKKRARREIGLGADDPVVLQLGRIVPRKGIDNVIEAIGLLRRRYGIEAKLLVVGGECEEPDAEATPEIARLFAVARSAGAEDLVRFEGRRPRNQLARYYSAADVFATTPWYEPFGITPLEAMACSTPVVGSDVGGIKSTVAHGETGYLVPPKDPDALAVRLACLLSNRELAESMGASGRARVLEHYTWKRVASAIATTYGAVIADHAARSNRTRSEFDLLECGFGGAVDAIQAARTAVREPLVKAAALIAEAFSAGNKVLVFGNGGSAADAQHFAGELVGRYRMPNRAGLPVVALTADSAVVTAWSNDVGYCDVFARQVEALGKPGDVALGISTSGQSENVLAGFAAAERLGLARIALAGRDGGELASHSDIALIVPHDDTQHIQEAHSVLIHLLCDLIERRLEPEPAAAANQAPVFDAATAAGGGS
jgi:D-inositol-3-phosphate glycosyltransferase